MAGLVCEPGDIGLPSGFLTSLRQVSGTIAAKIYVTILENCLTTTVPANVIPAASEAGLPSTSLTSLFTALSAGASSALESVPGITTEVIAATGNAIKIADSQAFKTNIDGKLTDQVARKFRGTEKIEAKELVGTDRNVNEKTEESEGINV